MTEEIKFPRPVAEYHRITIGRHGRGWAVFGRVYTDADGTSITRGGAIAAGYFDEALCKPTDPISAESLFSKVMQIKELAHAMRGDE